MNDIWRVDMHHAGGAVTVYVKGQKPTSRHLTNIAIGQFGSVDDLNDLTWWVNRIHTIPVELFK